MALYGADRDGRPLPGSPLVPDWSPSSDTLSVNDAGVTEAERTSPSRAFVFVLPEPWTRGPISLTAKALAARPSLFAYARRPEPLAASVCVSFRCGASPVRGLGGITFREQPPAKVVSALEVLYIPDGKLTGIPVPARRAFEKLLSLSPVPFVFLDSANRRTPWPTYRSVRFAPKGQITESTQAYDDATERLGDYVLGTFAFPAGAGYAPGPRVAVADATELAGSGGAAQRPVTIVAHEMLHLLGLGHADAACGGGGGGFPDPTGRMRSVGLDTVTGSGGGSAGSPPYRVIPDTTLSPGFDLMSYCSLSVGDPAHWISARNWNRLLGAGPPAGTHRARASGGSATPSITVRARVTGTGVALASVTPLPGTPPAPAGERASPYRLVARDAAGAVVASAALTQRTVPGALGGTPSVVTLEAERPVGGRRRASRSASSGVVASRSPQLQRAADRIHVAARGRAGRRWAPGDGWLARVGRRRGRAAGRARVLRRRRTDVPHGGRRRRSGPGDAAARHARCVAGAGGCACASTTASTPSSRGRPRSSWRAHAPAVTILDPVQRAAHPGRGGALPARRRGGRPGPPRRGRAAALVRGPAPARPGRDAERGRAGRHTRDPARGHRRRGPGRPRDGSDPASIHRTVLPPAVRAGAAVSARAGASA